MRHRSRRNHWAGNHSVGSHWFVYQSTRWQFAVSRLQEQETGSVCFDIVHEQFQYGFILPNNTYFSGRESAKPVRPEQPATAQTDDYCGDILKAFWKFLGYKWSLVIYPIVVLRHQNKASNTLWHSIWLIQRGDWWVFIVPDNQLNMVNIRTRMHWFISGMNVLILAGSGH